MGLSMRNTGSVGGSGMGFRRADGKRKSLLFRVLNINGRGREDENVPPVPAVPVMSGANGSIDMPMQML